MRLKGGIHWNVPTSTIYFLHLNILCWFFTLNQIWIKKYFGIFLIFKCCLRYEKALFVLFRMKSKRKQRTEFVWWMKRIWFYEYDNQHIFNGFLCDKWVPHSPYSFHTKFTPNVGILFYRYTSKYRNHYSFPIQFDNFGLFILQWMRFILILIFIIIEKMFDDDADVDYVFLFGLNWGKM